MDVGTGDAHGDLCGARGDLPGDTGGGRLLLRGEPDLLHLGLRCEGHHVRHLHHHTGVRPEAAAGRAALQGWASEHDAHVPPAGELRHGAPVQRDARRLLHPYAERRLRRGAGGGRDLPGPAPGRRPDEQRPRRAPGEGALHGLREEHPPAGRELLLGRAHGLLATAGWRPQRNPQDAPRADAALQDAAHRRQWRQPREHRHLPVGNPQEMDVWVWSAHAAGGCLALRGNRAAETRIPDAYASSRLEERAGLAATPRGGSGGEAPRCGR
mmetsp:Transcript_57469/g.168763  ORF Transcript_57469/g.168763 Transcript_57469/m.168763 type:complete len:269 (+) Transcript_57469:717-1523(+)